MGISLHGQWDQLEDNMIALLPQPFFEALPQFINLPYRSVFTKTKLNLDQGSLPLMRV
jgi:hypothetical protein